MTLNEWKINFWSLLGTLLLIQERRALVLYLSPTNRVLIPNWKCIRIQNKFLGHAHDCFNWMRCGGNSLIDTRDHEMMWHVVANWLWGAADRYEILLKRLLSGTLVGLLAAGSMRGGGSNLRAERLFRLFPGNGKLANTFFRQTALRRRWGRGNENWLRIRRRWFVFIAQGEGNYSQLVICVYLNRNRPPATKQYVDCQEKRGTIKAN